MNNWITALCLVLCAFVGCGIGYRHGKTGSAMNKYAIVLPTSYCFGTVVARLEAEDQPTTMRPYIAVKLRGLYKCEPGGECPFEMSLGGYQEMHVDTTGT